MNFSREKTSSLLSQKNVLFFFLILVLISPGLHAQNATVSGKVMDTDGMPIPDAIIYVLGTEKEITGSDTGGSYSIIVPALKEITLVIKRNGFEERRKKFELKEGENKTYNPQLEFKNILTGVTIVNDAKQDIIYIQPKDAFQLPGGSTDISKLLLAQGIGVQSSNELSTAYSVRGGNFDENLVYVNDIEVYRPFLVRSGQQEGLSFANPDMVSSMQFSAGGFEAKYGDKLSSVLDITYRKPRKFAGSVTGSLLGGSVHLEGISKNKLLSWQIGSRYRSTQYLLNSLDTKGDYKPRFYDVQTLLNFNIAPKFMVEVLGNVSSNKYIVVPQTRETTFGTFNQALQLKVYFDGQEVSNYTTMFGAVSATYKPRDSLRLKFIASAFNTQEAETFTVQGQYFIDELENDFGSANFGNVAFNRGIGTFINHGRNYLDATVLNTEHKGRWQKRNSELLWGVRAQHEIIHDKLSEWNYVDSAGYSIPQYDPTQVELRDVLKTKIFLESTRGMAYTEYILSKQLKDTSNLTITAGVRSNYWTLNQQNVISPRVTIAYKPNWNANWLFKASGGYYYQPPFYREMRDFQGNINKDLKAQQSIHYVLSGDLNYKMWGRPFKFITAAYFKQLNNLVPYEIDNVRLRYFANNNSKGYATGIDMRLNGEFVKGIESWASMSVMTIREKIIGGYYYQYLNKDGIPIKAGVEDTRIADSVRVEGGYIPRPTDQRVTFNLFFQDYLPKLPTCKMHLNLIFGSGLPFWTPNHKKYPYDKNQRMPPYRRVDIGFSYQVVKEGKQYKEKSLFRWCKSAWLSLEVLNLLAVNNTVSYTWIKDVTNRQYAIPNYLTNRQLNLKLQLKF
ncbi:MAG: carboxypeptidase regulatory-like domain-containing protein [Bacteroidia bacterium]